MFGGGGGRGAVFGSVWQPKKKDGTRDPYGVKSLPFDSGFAGLNVPEFLFWAYQDPMVLKGPETLEFNRA